MTTIEDFLLNTLKRFSNLRAGDEQTALRALQEALCQADARIFEATAEHPEWQGMGTTLTMAFAVNWRLFVAHAGDSRCYLYSSGKLQELTKDHTMSAETGKKKIASRKFPKSKSKIPSRTFPKGIATIASRPFAKAAAKEKKAAAVRLNRPADEKARQARVAVLRNKTTAFKFAAEL